MILEDKLKEIQEKLLEGLEEAFSDYADTVEEQSKVLVPVDTGALKESFFKEVKVSSGRIGLNIGYDEKDELGYAVIVHEHPEYRHEPPTRNKFLEIPLKNNLRNLKKSVEEEVGKALKSIKTEEVTIDG